MNKNGRYAEQGRASRAKTGQHHASGSTGGSTGARQVAGRGSSGAAAVFEACARVHDFQALATVVQYGTSENPRPNPGSQNGRYASHLKRSD